jgi:hypothetical protein
MAIALILTCYAQCVIRGPGAPDDAPGCARAGVGRYEPDVGLGEGDGVELDDAFWTTISLAS